jgi:hypothetical protein
VLSFSVVGADETWWRLMSAKTSGGSTKRWYVWALGVEKGVHYRLFDDRSKEAARQLLEGYVGTVMCDGYSSYEALAKSGGRFVLAHCRVGGGRCRPPPLPDPDVQISRIRFFTEQIRSGRRSDERFVAEAAGAWRAAA